MGKVQGISSKECNWHGLCVSGQSLFIVYKPSSNNSIILPSHSVMSHYYGKTISELQPQLPFRKPQTLQKLITETLILVALIGLHLVKNEMVAKKASQDLFRTISFPSLTDCYFCLQLSMLIFGLTCDFLSRNRFQAEVIASVLSGRQAARCGRGL